MDALKLLSRSTDLKTKTAKPGVLPSQGPRTVETPDEAQSKTASHLRKRKRADNPESHTYSEAECRSIFKQHKIKVVDLRVLHHYSGGTKKAQKEAAQIFPQPLTAFKQLRNRYGVSQPLADSIASQGYYETAEVQLATIPLLMQGEQPDLLTVAPTGSGKTLAFLVPLLHKLSGLLEESSQATKRHAGAFIIAPTKELVGQILNECRKLVIGTGLTIQEMRKGRSVDGVDIVVSTPPSLANALQSEGLRHAQHITDLILDEADVLLDPLFREQTLSIWSACKNPTLRVSLWSATIGSNIEELAVNTIKERQTQLQLKEPTPLVRCVVGLKDSALPTISHKLIYTATEPGKLLALRQLLHPPSRLDSSKQTSAPLRPPFLVFTQTIERAGALHTELLYDIPSEAGGSERVAVLHSALSDTKRSDVMSRFRQAQIWVLITTDLLSRGIDFRGVNGVVNYDIPTTTAAYIHRAGRTGRAGREGGVCVTLYTKDDVKYVRGIANVIAASSKKVSDEGHQPVVQKWLLDALPEVGKNEKKQLKTRGVEHRRSVRKGDDVKVAKAKRKARIGTKSGYDKREENRRQGAVEGSRRRKEEVESEGDGKEWTGF